MNRPAADEQTVALTFFNDFEADTVEAIAERIIPGGDGNVGATDAGVVYYVDRAVSGFSVSLQKVYRLGLRELEAFCQAQVRPFLRSTHRGAPGRGGASVSRSRERRGRSGAQLSR